MLIKIYDSYRYVVAICDASLLGKKFEEGKLQLDVKSNFFDGDLFNEKDAIKKLQDMDKEDATFNIVGRKSVNAALKAGIISEEGVRIVQGIPFALTLL